MPYFYLNEELDRVEGILPESNPIAFGGTLECYVPETYLWLRTHTAKEILGMKKLFVIEEERAAILAELDALDRRSARALRAVVAGTATEEDKAALAAIEAEAVSKRARLAGLEE